MLYSIVLYPVITEVIKLMFESKLKKKVFFDSTSERVISKTNIARTTKLVDLWFYY